MEVNQVLKYRKGGQVHKLIESLPNSIGFTEKLFIKRTDPPYKHKVKTEYYIETSYSYLTKLNEIDNIYYWGDIKDTNDLILFQIKNEYLYVYLFADQLENKNEIIYHIKNGNEPIYEIVYENLKSNILSRTCCKKLQLSLL